jgi:hypothetical protein
MHLDIYRSMLLFANGLGLMGGIMYTISVLILPEGSVQNEIQAIVAL